MVKFQFFNVYLFQLLTEVFSVASVSCNIHLQYSLSIYSINFYYLKSYHARYMLESFDNWWNSLLQYEDGKWGLNRSIRILFRELLCFCYHNVNIDIFRSNRGILTRLLHSIFLWKRSADLICSFKTSIDPFSYLLHSNNYIHCGF